MRAWRGRMGLVACMGEQARLVPLPHAPNLNLPCPLSSSSILWPCRCSPLQLANPGSSEETDFQGPPLHLCCTTPLACYILQTAGARWATAALGFWVAFYTTVVDCSVLPNWLQTPEDIPPGPGGAVQGSLGGVGRFLHLARDRQRTGVVRNLYSGG
jgi:hypothetical protein